MGWWQLVSVAQLALGTRGKTRPTERVCGELGYDGSMRQLKIALLPSLTAAALAVFVVGLGESIAAGGSLYRAISSAGFLGYFALPVAVLLSLAVRALMRAWGFSRLLTLEAPKLAAAATLAIAVPIVLGCLSYVGAITLASRTQAPVVIAIGSALWMGAIGVLLVATSRPLYRLLVLVFDRLATARPALLTNRSIAAGAAVFVVVALGAIWWLAIRPQIGHFNIGPILWLVTLAALLVAVHLAWRLEPRARRPLGGVAAVLSVAAVVASLHAKSANPDTVLAIWGEQPLVGKTVDFYFDVDGLAEARNNAAIAPKPIRAQHPDILFVTIDTVRADSTPPYGGKARMPALTKLASIGKVFDWAFSAGNVTRRSIATIATCLSPHRVRGRVVGWSLKLDPRHVLFAERLRAVGYATSGFFWNDKFFGPNRFGGGLSHTEFSADGALELAKRAKQFLGRSSTHTGTRAPKFTWVHFIDPHNWRKEKAKPPKSLKTKEKVRWRYERSLMKVDRALERLLEAPVKNPAGRIVIVTADHGEGLGERGALHHSTNLYNSQIRVPLVIAGEGIAAGRIAQPVGHADLGPTILTLAGYQGDPDSVCDGRSLAAMVRNEAPADASGGFAHAAMVPDRSVSERADAIVIGKYKYIEGPGSVSELFDLAADPTELSDIRARLPEVTERMRKKLKSMRAEEPRPPFPPAR